MTASPLKTCIIGSGNWGSVIAKIVGGNALQHPDKFANAVTMYVYEELIDGVKLTEIINTRHENVKYLPGCKLPENVVAYADVMEASTDADILVFVLPHQFISQICHDVSGRIKKSAVAVSLIKGLEVKDGRLSLISNAIRKTLGIPVAVLMGANVANEVAAENFCEATIGCKNSCTGRTLKELFQTPYFRISVVPDEETVELCGALKNVVAIGAGFMDGLRQGDNTKAAIIRLGLMEIITFCRHFYPKTKTETFLESCGVADLITTCYSGRNRKVAAAFAANPEKTIPELEQEMLNGQKLQGPSTAADVCAVLKRKDAAGTNLMQKFPIFTAVHKICSGEMHPNDFLASLKDHPEHR